MRSVDRRNQRLHMTATVFTRGGGAPRWSAERKRWESSTRLAVPGETPGSIRRVVALYNDVLCMRLHEARLSKREARQKERQTVGLGGSRQVRRLGINRVSWATGAPRG